jgi:hypothetical protein
MTQGNRAKEKERNNKQGREKGGTNAGFGEERKCVNGKPKNVGMCLVCLVCVCDNEHTPPLQRQQQQLGVVAGGLLFVRCWLGGDRSSRSKNCPEKLPFLSPQPKEEVKNRRKVEKVRLRSCLSVHMHPHNDVSLDQHYTTLLQF